MSELQKIEQAISKTKAKVTVRAQEFWNFATRNSYEREPKSFVDWLNTEFFLSPEATNSNGPFECYPSQVGIAHFYANLDIAEVHNQKCGQAGCTQIFKGLCGYEVSVRGRNTAVIQPTQGFANWFSGLQIRTLLRDCPTVGSELRVDPEKRNDSQNTTKLRLFMRAALYCRGAYSSNDFRGYSVETMMVDEVDGAPPDIDGEGSVDALASSRIKEAARPKQINQSTPTVDGESRIQALAASVYPEHSFRYKAECLHCGHRQQLVWGGADAMFGIQWNKIYRDDGATGDERAVDIFATSQTAHYKCRACLGTFTHDKLREVDEGGRWESTTMYLDNASGDFFSLETDEKVATPYKVAIYMKGTMSYVMTWQRAVYEFLEALDLAQKGDPSKLIKFENGYLGEVHIPLRNKDLATWDGLKQRKRKYKRCPDWVQYVTVGADVGQNHIAYEIVGWGADYESISLEYRRTECVPLKDNSVRKTLKKLGNRKFKKKSGEEISVGLVLCDSKYGGAKVREACAENPQKLIPITGYGTLGAPPVKMSNDPEPHTGVFVARVGIQTCADTISELHKVQLPEGKKRAPGYSHFPDTPWHDDDYFKQMCGETIKVTYRNGRPESKWVQKSKAVRVEVTDCRRYSYAGLKLAELRYGFELMDDKVYLNSEKRALAEDDGYDFSDIAEERF